jgi:zinc transport system ATP-binding protein
MMSVRTAPFGHERTRLTDSAQTTVPEASTVAEEVVIEFGGVWFSYDGLPVLEDVDLAIRRGEFACIVGPNGGGKTTLLKLALGLIAPDRGLLRVLGRPPRRVRPRLGYTPQYVQFDAEFPASVMDVVLMGRLGIGRSIGPCRKEDRRAARDALAEVGLADHEKRSFAGLSGGQRQRVLIARALAARPDVLLMDEPTSNLDPRTEGELHDLLHRLNENATIALVSHDVGFVCEMVHRVICVNRTVSVHNTRELTAEVIAEMYGRHVRAIDHDAGCLGDGRS